jgi:hypothetical protein
MNKVCILCNESKPATPEFFHRYRYSKDGLYPRCKECRKVDTKGYREKNLEKIKASQKEYYHKNKDTLREKNKKWRENNAEYVKTKGKEYRDTNRDALIEYQKRWREVNKATRKWDYSQRKYGIDQQQFNMLAESQGNCCKICSTPFVYENDLPSKDVHIDHNHDTGDVRGLLCSKCNYMLGFARDSKKILLAGAKYLEDNGTYGE